MLCVHCHDRKASNSGRGLCRSCWNSPGIRNRYRPAVDQSFRGDPTEAELEALIRERSRPENLPPWWEAETRRELEHTR